MVKRKITSALFIILANLVLMLHAIIPHHYHYNNLCFEFPSEELHASHDDCEDHGNDHKHYPEKENDHCFLQEIVALSSGVAKQNIRITLISGNSNNDISINALLNQGIGLVDDSHNILQSLPPNRNSKYLLFASGTPGLRAPPQVS